MDESRPQVLPRPELVSIDDGVTTYRFTDHNRSPLSVDVERIENSRRTARGKRRRFFIDDKRKFSIDWELIPGEHENTVDGLMGFKSIKSFYDNTTGSVTLKVRERDGTTSDYTVHVTKFTFNIKYRYLNDDWYNCSIEFEEV